MTRFLWDKYSKDYLQDMIVPYGTVEVGKSIAPEIKEIDVWFSPGSSEIPPALGLLGRFCRHPCLFEPYHNPVTLKEVSDCLSKRLAVLEELERESKRRKERLRAGDMPKLWILTPTASPRILEPFSGHLRPDWGEGVYFLAEGLGSAVVVIHQLPERPETLWVRLLGRGGTRERAVDELEALPSDNPLRSLALQSLYNLSKNLEALPRKSQEDRYFIMRLAPLYQQDREQALQEGRAEGLREGRAEGLQEGEAREAVKLVLQLLQHRFGEIPPNLSEQIRGLPLEQVEDLAKALLDFDGPADLAGWLEL